MPARWRRCVLESENGELREVRERTKEAGFPSHCKPVRKMWSWERLSESWKSDVKIPGVGTLEHGFPVVGNRKWCAHILFRNKAQHFPIVLTLTNLSG